MDPRILSKMSTENLELENQSFMRQRDALREMFERGEIEADEFRANRDAIKEWQRAITAILNQRAAWIREAELASHGVLPIKGEDGLTQTIEALSIETEEGFGQHG